MFSGRNIYGNRSPSDEYEKIIDRNALKLLKVVIVDLSVVLLSFSFILIGPAYAFTFHGAYNLISRGVVPFTDLDTFNGFIINLIVQGAAGLVALAGTIAIEIVNCLIINACTVMTDLACCSMQKFSAGLVAGTFSEQNKAELRDIFVRLQDLENYIHEFNDMYYWKLFLQPILTTPCVSLAIFAQMEVCSSFRNDRIEFNFYHHIHPFNRMAGWLVTDLHRAYTPNYSSCVTWETVFKWR